MTFLSKKILNVGFLITIAMTYPIALFCDESEDAFSNIYKHKVWGTNEEGEAHSGGGSTLSNTIVYRAFLQNFLKEYGIKSVVDAGCGDWEFSKTIDWTGIEYTGCDVVKSVVQNNKRKYGKGNIRFLHIDATQSTLPNGELLICKDVLQHLSNALVSKFLLNACQFRYCLITNDVDDKTLTADNIDIPVGSSRLIDLTKPPFNLNGSKVLTYRTSCGMKQVLLLQNGFEKKRNLKRKS